MFSVKNKIKRRKLTTRQFSQLAPDDAYLSCKYFPPPGGGYWNTRLTFGFADYDVRCKS
jgi:hypothetical protein